MIDLYCFGDRFMPQLPFIPTMLALAIGLYFILDSIKGVNSRNQTPDPAVTLAYNAISQGVDMLLFDDSGELIYSLQAEQQVHLKDASSNLVEPVIRHYQDGETRWNIVADSGTVKPHDGTDPANTGTIELSGAIEIQLQDSFGNSTVLTTDYLAIDTRVETMETDRPVKLNSATIEQAARGLFANLNSNRLVFRADSRGKYEGRVQP